MKKNNNIEPVIIKDYYKNHKRSKTRDINKLKIVYSIIAIIIIFIIAIYAVLKFVSNPTDTYIVTRGELSKNEPVIGYIVREETEVQGKNYKNGMIKIKDDGEKTAKDESIFRYYSSGEEELKKKITDLDLQIQKLMENESTIFTGDIKLLESQIDSTIDSYYDVTSTQKIVEYKKKLSSYINKKAQISGEQSPAGSELKKLIDERNTYEKELADNSEYVKAPSSGIVSYRVDGLESVLTTDDFNKFNKEFLENLKLKTNQIIASSEEKGKIINGYMCYIIFNSDSDEAKNVKNGDRIQIRLQNASTTTRATVTNIITESDDSKTITLQIEKNVEDLINYRKISFDIVWWSEEGFKIPNSSLVEEKDHYYVVRNRNGYYNKMLVKILKQNDEFSIVKAYSNDELKQMNFTTTEIYNMKNISLYDEIVLNPTEEEVLQ